MDIAIPYLHTGPSAFGDDLDYVAQLSAALARSGHTVTVYARRGDPPLPRCAHQGRSRVHRLPAGPAKPLTDQQVIPAVQRFTEELLGCWRARPPDLVHAQQWPAALATELAAQELGLPTVVTHHLPPSAANDEQSSARRITARHADWLVVPNTTHATHLRRRFGSRTQITVIPWGVDGNHYNPEGRVAPRGDVTHRLVLFSSGCGDDGSETVIEALTAIADTELLIVHAPQTLTTDPDRHADSIQALAHQHGVAQRVHTHSGIDEAELPALLRSADIVVHLPRTDPVGSIPLKAMACGVPVITSAVDAPADIVIDNVTGHLLTPINPRHCATTVNRLLAQPFQRHALGAAGRDRARSRYSWDRIAADTAHIYQQALTPAADELS